MLTVFKYRGTGGNLNTTCVKLCSMFFYNEIHLHNQNALNAALFMEEIYVQKDTQNQEP